MRDSLDSKVKRILSAARAAEQLDQAATKIGRAIALLDEAADCIESASGEADEELSYAVWGHPQSVPYNLDVVRDWLRECQAETAAAKTRHDPKGGT